MSEYMTIKDIDRAANAIRARIDLQPEVGMILGTGLGGVADRIKDAVIIPNEEIPCWPQSTVEGHKGRLVIGELKGVKVFILQGRTHYYEGYSMGQTTLSVRVMQRLGCDKMIVTNAAGAINPDFLPGDLMLINDHLNLIGISGANPLKGPNLDEFGVRFPDMSQPYDRVLLDLARQACQEIDLPYQEGVYAALAGPSFETPAELRFLHTIGADAVGMSTVPEVIVANHMGMKVLGISCITDLAVDGVIVKTSVEEILEAASKTEPIMTKLVKKVIEKID